MVFTCIFVASVLNPAISFAKDFSHAKGNNRVKQETYISCGCGCCPSTLDKPIIKCLDPSKGETIDVIKKMDQQKKESKDCELQGCSQAILYKKCS